MRENARDDKLKEIQEKLVDGIENMFDSEKYKQWLSTVSMFHNYSLNNTILIMMQKPNATQVAGFGVWKKLGRYVKKGEKAITIFAPIKCKRIVEEEDGTQKEIVFTRFKTTSVFDVSQTDGKEIADICNNLEDDSDFDDAISCFVDACPVPVDFEEINTGANGFYEYGNRICVDSRLSNAQKLKTLVHEMAHEKLHKPDDGKDRQTKEMEAESVAYIVCQYLGVDTSDYSFGYIAGWGTGKEMSVIKDTLKGIRDTANELIVAFDAMQNVSEAA